MSKEHDLDVTALDWVVAITGCRECLEKKWPGRQFDAVSVDGPDGDDVVGRILFKDDKEDEYGFEYHMFNKTYELDYYTTDGGWGPTVNVKPLNPVPRNE